MCCSLYFISLTKKLHRVYLNAHSRIYKFTKITFKYKWYISEFWFATFQKHVNYVNIKSGIYLSFIWPMGYRNARLHNMIMVSYWHLPCLWFTPLHLDFNEMYPRYHHQMTVLTRYIFRHEIYVNNIITLSSHYLKKVAHYN